MVRLPVFILLLCLALPSSLYAATPRHALVIGNSAYSQSPLENPENDAMDIAHALEGFGFKVTLIKNGSLRQMEKAVRDLSKKLMQGGVGLFYYAGHGAQVKGENYLLPVDAEIESEADVRYEAMSASRVLDHMELADNQMNIVILDACRNNPFTRSFRAAQLGLARMNAPTGAFMAYATAPGSIAADGTGRNGVYTKHLLKAMKEPGLTLTQVFMRVRRNVMHDTEGAQVPWESSSLTGEFYFSPPANATVSSSGATDSGAVANDALASQLTELKQQLAVLQNERGATHLNSIVKTSISPRKAQKEANATSGKLVLSIAPPPGLNEKYYSIKKILQRLVDRNDISIPFVPFVTIPGAYKYTLNDDVVSQMWINGLRNEPDKDLMKQIAEGLKANYMLSFSYHIFKPSHARVEGTLSAYIYDIKLDKYTSYKNTYRYGVGHTIAYKQDKNNKHIANALNSFLNDFLARRN